MSSITYRPEIDGLRAVAILPVILFHFNNDLLPGGYIGVDVFFVISGFLITSIILDEYDRGVFSFSNFWSRRIRRILPALTVMVLTTLVVGSRVLYAADINNFGAQGVSTLLSFANISHLLLAGNYWGDSAENSPFLHAWSLSVEEQYYLIFPVLCFIALKYYRQSVTRLIFAFTFISFLAFLYGAQTYPAATFYLLPTRAWELGVGALLASAFFKKGPIRLNHHSLLSAVGILMVLISYFVIRGNEGVSTLVVIPVLGCSIIIAFANGADNGIKKILSASPFVYIGKVSYSLYLWHWPILVFSRQASLSKTILANSIGVFAMIFLMAILSYYFIEIPTRRNTKVVPYILAVLSIGVVFSFYLKVGDFAENTSRYNKTEWYGSLYKVNPDREWPESVKKRMVGITVARNEGGEKNAYASGGIKKLYGGENPDIVVLGDSHALMWAKVLDEIAKELSASIAFYSADGTSAFFRIPPIKMASGTPIFSAEEKYIFDEARLKSLAEWKPKVVVIASRWSGVNLDETRDLIRYIGNIDSNILLIEQPPELFFGDKNAPQYLSYLGIRPKSSRNRYVRRVNGGLYQNGLDVVRQIEEENNRCTRVPISDLYLYGNKAWVMDSSDVLYIDDDHLSYSGALKAKSRIAEALKKLFNK